MNVDVAFQDLEGNEKVLVGKPLSGEDLFGARSGIWPTLTRSQGISG
jgi:hypothetical protein